MPPRRRSRELLLLLLFTCAKEKKIYVAERFVYNTQPFHLTAVNRPTKTSDARPPAECYFERLLWKSFECSPRVGNTYLSNIQMRFTRRKLNRTGATSVFKIII